VNQRVFDLLIVAAAVVGVWLALQAFAALTGG
jgi:hypothetical protein